MKLKIPIIFAFVIILDIATTYLVLQIGGIEGNPLGYTPITIFTSGLLVVLLFIMYPIASVSYPKLKYIVYSVILFKICVILWNIHWFFA